MVFLTAESQKEWDKKILKEWQRKRGWTKFFSRPTEDQKIKIEGDLLTKDVKSMEQKQKLHEESERVSEDKKYVNDLYEYVSPILTNEDVVEKINRLKEMSFQGDQFVSLYNETRSLMETLLNEKEKEEGMPPIDDILAIPVLYLKGYNNLRSTTTITPLQSLFIYVKTKGKKPNVFNYLQDRIVPIDQINIIEYDDIISNLIEHDGLTRDIEDVMIPPNSEAVIKNGGKLRKRAKSKRTKSKRTKSKRTKSKRTKSKRTKSKRTKSKRTKRTKSKSLRKR